jgi:hypothetical protein
MADCFHHSICELRPVRPIGDSITSNYQQLIHLLYLYIDRIHRQTKQMGERLVLDSADDLACY